MWLKKVATYTEDEKQNEYNGMTPEDKVKF